MVEHSRQALVGAIGGTFISLALMDIDEFSVGNFALLNSADFHSPMEALERYLKSLPKVPDKIGLSIAGKIDGDKATTTPLSWNFDRNDIRAATGCTHVSFVNEFEALALATPTLSSYDLININVGTIKRTATRAVISAGTGLGAAALIWAGDKWIAVSGVSALASFPPTLGHEFDIRSIIAHEGFAHAGQILTGHGLVALYQGLVREAGGTPAKLTAEQITQAGLTSRDEHAARALQLMATWLGRFSGDLALHFGASGGVYLAGGMPTGISPALQSAHFRDAFEGVGDRHAFLGDVPVNVIKAGADAGLRGAAISLANSLPTRGTASIRRLRA